MKISINRIIDKEKISSVQIIRLKPIDQSRMCNLFSDLKSRYLSVRILVFIHRIALPSCYLSGKEVNKNDQAVNRRKQQQKKKSIERVFEKKKINVDHPRMRGGIL